MGFFSTWFGLLVRPIDTLTRLEKRDPALGLETATGFATMALFLGASLVTLLFLTGAVLVPDPAFRVFGIIGGLLFFGLFVLLGVIGVFLGAVWYHLWLRLFGVKDFRKTLAIYCYARAPALLQILFFVPQLGGLVLYFIISIWSLALFVFGIRVFHGLPQRSAGTLVAMATAVNLFGIAIQVAGFPPTVLLLPQVSAASIEPVFQALASASVPGAPVPGPLGPG